MDLSGNDFEHIQVGTTFDSLITKDLTLPIPPPDSPLSDVSTLTAEDFPSPISSFSSSDFDQDFSLEQFIDPPTFPSYQAQGDHYSSLDSLVTQSSESSLCPLLLRLRTSRDPT